MYQLSTQIYNGVEVVDSREVADMVERDHNELLKTIRVYIGHLVEGEVSHCDFFIESTYLAANNRRMPNYLITKKGCDMVANKMIGAKGVIFTAAYVTAFEKMHTAVTAPVTPAQLALQQAQIMVEMERRLNTVEALALETTAKLDTAIKIYSHPNKDHWCEDMNAAIADMSGDSAGKQMRLRGVLYRELERETNRNINSRLRRLRDRKKKGGATSVEYSALNKLDAIAASKELRLIFEGIVKKHQAQIIGGK